MRLWFREHWRALGLVTIAAVTWGVECWDATHVDTLERLISRMTALGFLGFYVIQDLQFWIEEGLFEYRASRAGQGGYELQDEPEPLVVPFVEDKPAYRVNGHKVDAVEFFEGGDDAWHTKDAA